MSEELQRVEKHKITKSDEIYSFIDTLCLASKNLYNHANYLIRETYFKNHTVLSYETLNKILKNDKKYPDYTSLPLIQSSQQTLRLLSKNWKSYLESSKDYNKNPSKYKGRPKIPKYLDKKKGRYTLIITNQNFSIRDNEIQFTKAIKNLKLKTKITERDNFIGVNQVRILPRNNFFLIEVVYTIKKKDSVNSNKNLISIDLGINNLATITNNIGKKPLIINGKGLSSKNQYYNKKLAKFKSTAEKRNKIKTTKRIQSLTNKRNNIIDNFMHQVSRYLINYCKENDISTIIIGNNKDWKQGVNLSKVNNQKFVEIPFKSLIDKISYKAEEEGIKVILIEESYTSGTSLLDFEDPIKSNYNKKRRIKRGLFKSNQGVLINADVNASYQITKKVYKDIYKNQDEINRLNLIPSRINISI